eukprot:7752534-Lingulodinium_polyedra.AAC.1
MACVQTPLFAPGPRVLVVRPMDAALVENASPHVQVLCGVGAVKQDALLLHSRSARAQKPASVP